MGRLVQIEVTTRCNFTCYYCTGRKMEQADMTWDTFKRIADAMPPDVTQVRLQGEGEPLLWKHFEQAVRLLTSKGIAVNTITNGSIYSPSKVMGLEYLGISLDTINPERAKDIGRHNLPRVLGNIARYRKLLPVVLYRVSLFDDELWPTDLPVISQPLQEKEDYVKMLNL